MVAKKKAPVKKKKAPVKKKTKSKVGSAPGAGLKKYANVIKNTPAVKREAERLKVAEAKVKEIKKKKAAAVKVARKRYAATH